MDKTVSTSFEFKDEVIPDEVYDKISNGVYNTFVGLYNEKYLTIKPLNVVVESKQNKNGKRFSVEILFKESPSEEDFPIDLLKELNG